MTRTAPETPTVILLLQMALVPISSLSKTSPGCLAATSISSAAFPALIFPPPEEGSASFTSRADVEGYILAGQDTGAGRYVANRKPGSRPTVALSGEAAPFDPAAYARSLAKDKA